MPYSRCDLYSPRHFGALSDADEGGVNLGVAVHDALEVLCGDTVPSKVRIGDGDDKPVI